MSPASPPVQQTSTLRTPSAAYFAADAANFPAEQEQNTPATVTPDVAVPAPESDTAAVSLAVMLAGIWGIAPREPERKRRPQLDPETP